MHKLREELIEDILTYLQEIPLSENEFKSKAVEIQNTVTQIIVDTFDEYEIGNQILIKK